MFTILISSFKGDNIKGDESKVNSNIKVIKT